MPVIIAALLGGLAQVAASLVGRVLIALGIGYVTYTGVDVLVQGMLSYAQASWSAFPADVLEVITALRVPQSVAISASGLAAQVAVRTTAGAITRQVLKGPQ